MAKRKALSIGDPLVLTCQETVIFALEADATQKAQEKWKQLRERIGIDKNKTDGIVQDILKSQIESPHLVVLNRNTSGFQLSDESGKVIAYFRPSFESRKDLKDHDNHGRFGSIQFQVYGEWPTHVPINQRSLVEGKGFLLKHLIRALALDFEVRCEGYVRAFTAKDMLILTPKEEDEFLAVQEHLDKKRKIVEEQHAKTYKIELAKQLLLRMERVIEEYIKIQKEENKLIEKVKRPTLGHWVVKDPECNGTLKLTNPYGGDKNGALLSWYWQFPWSMKDDAIRLEAELYKILTEKGYTVTDLYIFLPKPKALSSVDSIQSNLPKPKAAN